MDAGPGDAAQGVDAGVEAWLAGLSALIAELTDRWELELTEPMPGGSPGYVVAATRAGTGPVVLKLTYPDGWFPERVAALLAWDGEGAVELIDHDPRGAMLLERAVPGTPLADEPEERALALARDVAQRLWIAAPDGITAVTDEVGRWVSTFRDRNDALGRLLSAELLDDATASMRDLEAPPDEPVLLHGDLRLGNVLAAEREPWLAISPHPLVGDRGFDLAVLTLERAVDLLHEPEPLVQRFRTIAELEVCDRDRLAAWTVVLATDEALRAAETAPSDVAAGAVAIADAARALAS